MQVMTPDLAIQRCGQPARDVIEGSTRLMYFARPLPGVVLNFGRREDGKWYFAWMTPGGFVAGSAVPEGKPIFETEDAQGHLVDDKAWKEIDTLPCLSGSPVPTIQSAL